VLMIYGDFQKSTGWIFISMCTHTANTHGVHFQTPCSEFSILGAL